MINGLQIVLNMIDFIGEGSNRLSLFALIHIRYVYKGKS